MRNEPSKNTPITNPDPTPLNRAMDPEDPSRGFPEALGRWRETCLANREMEHTGPEFLEAIAMLCACAELDWDLLDEVEPGSEFPHELGPREIATRYLSEDLFQ